MTTLHIQQASLQRGDPSRQIESDLSAVFERMADIVSLTEAPEDSRTADILRAVARDHGYRVTDRGPGDVHVAVLREHRVRDEGWIETSDAAPPSHPLGGHAARGIRWVEVDFEGEDVWFGAGHWDTGFRASAERARTHTALTEEFGKQMRRQAKGPALGFLGGDLNVAVDDAGNITIPKVRQAFEDARIETIWDELNLRKPTHKKGLTIDLIGRYAHDRRVSAHKIRRWGPGFADHIAFSVYYRIESRGGDSR